MSIVQVDVVACGIDVVIDQNIHDPGVDHLRHHVLARFQFQPFCVRHTGIPDGAGARPVVLKVSDVAL